MIDSITEKLCPCCKTVKKKHQFHPSKIEKDGMYHKCKKCRAEKQHEHYVVHKERLLGKQRERNYGLSDKEYKQMLIAQGGVCACCKQEEKLIIRGKVVKLAVDHCHTTDAVRGLLCFECNAALGLLCNDPARAQALLEYIYARVLW